MECPWSSQACGISGIRSEALAAAAIFVLLASCASAATLHSGSDIQATIDKANPGDTILVGPGDYGPFDVNKPLTVVGTGMPLVRAAIQRPGITLSSEGAVVSGFKIKGVCTDSSAKFNYYISKPAEASVRFDLPDAAVMAEADDVVLKDSSIFGAEAGAYAEEIHNTSLTNITFISCVDGAKLMQCQGGNVEGCKFLKCDKTGLRVEGSRGIVVSNITAADSVHVGVLIKESTGCKVNSNTATGNIEGIALWNSSNSEVSGNVVSRNYYGILLSGSNNNTVTDNTAVENTRSEVIKGFGIGISLERNSSNNVVAWNDARRNYNGLEVTKGCQLNVLYCNKANDNDHGIRMDKNWNNLIYANSFSRNKIDAYENASHNCWNTTVGNYYSNYKGDDLNGDCIGDSPYSITSNDADSKDYLPLMQPYMSVEVDVSVEELRSMARTYARYHDGDAENALPYKVSGGIVVIESRRPARPPKWPSTPSNMLSF